MRPSGANPPVFPLAPDYRASGILAHVTSLPSDYGIGDLGPGARAWIDCLQAAGQGWWQVLPLGPTGYGDSPYQSLSSFAGNELLISPDDLLEDGLLLRQDCAGAESGAPSVDYAAVTLFKQRILLTAWRNFAEGARPDLRSAFAEFCGAQSHWLEDYALFRALKARFHWAAYLDWPAELVRREPGAVQAARREMAAQCDVTRFAQFLLCRQGTQLKEYARSRGLGLLGDLPFYVSPDSSDVWAAPELFRLDEQRRPVVVAGVPPDYFSATGQLWGNPIYDWEALQRDQYRWWIDRLRAALAYVDVVRLDHFRAFAAAWCVPAGSLTAESGKWVPGPGADFFAAVQAELGGLPFVAEDLGLITPDVEALRERFGLPGMRVIQFAFDGSRDNPHLPCNYAHNSIVYTGTHDNPTSRAWLEALPEKQRQNVWNCLRHPAGTDADGAPALIEMVWNSAAALAMTPLQDLLNLGDGARMNRPGSTGGNWRWRCPAGMPNPSHWQWLHDLTVAARRAPPPLTQQMDGS